jgi:hypothetical protein
VTSERRAEVGALVSPRDVPFCKAVQAVAHHTRAREGWLKVRGKSTQEERHKLTSETLFRARSFFYTRPLLFHIALDLAVLLQTYSATVKI